MSSALILPLLYILILDGNQPIFVIKSCNPIECNKYAGHVLADLFLCVHNFFFFLKECSFVFVSVYDNTFFCMLQDP